MRKSKLIKILLIPTLGITAMGTVAAVSTGCSCSIISHSYYLTGSTTVIDITWNGPSYKWVDSDTWMLVNENGEAVYDFSYQTAVMVTEKKSPRGEKAMEEAIANGLVIEGEKWSQKRSKLTFFV